ncbi:hypothetical protein H072_5113 [Dactylellina haptotyla CBS 200.50]|uniref:Exonuclease domain-containing protein n=1 Tax=Dactylellina haptotyla (strain CBS 200.50) TaxID=1284197 RepID=S8ADH7_DACHA|nr:hypothetical protein H072_5113 [Dactylellina haptotyla CBS 200.50]
MARRTKKRSHRGDRKKQPQDKEHSPLPTLPSFGDLPIFNLDSTAAATRPEKSSRKRSIDELSDTEPGAVTADRSSAKRSRPDDDSKPKDDDGWQHVTYKKNNKRDGSYPEFVLSSQRINTWTRITDLQSLIFHILSHDAPPNWMLVKNKSAIRRVVYLHVPGLSMDLFDGRVNVSSDKSEGQESGQHSTLGEYFPVSIRSGHSLPTPLKDLSEIFTHVLPVRAGGDNNKLFSPIHNMLNVPLETEDDKGIQKKHHRKQSKPRLKISELILSPEDLVENEYPLHSTHSKSADSSEQSIPMAEGWLETDLSATPPRTFESGSVLEGYTLYSLDCEMVKTASGPTLARISLINWDGDVVLDELVKPAEEIEDYLTAFSGITPTLLKDVTTTITDIQKKLQELLTGNAILIGQSLNSDLNALKFRHPWIVDTSVIFDHPRGKPMKPSLKWLSQKFLRKEIQRGNTAAGGHDSVEDSRACLELVKLKLERGKEFGSNTGNFESIFTKLSQVQPQAKTSGVVDYGDPEKRYGSLAQFVRKVHDDDGVVDGVLTAVNGDDMNGIAPVSFVWAQMKALNEVRGWNNSYQKFINQMNASVITATSPAIEIPEKPAQPDAAVLGKAVGEMVGRIKRVYEGLPKCSALVVYGGTGDPVEMGRLNAVQAVYRKEFKVKKWDECSVRWTDDEEQALRRAVGEARKGIALLAVR